MKFFNFAETLLYVLVLCSVVPHSIEKGSGTRCCIVSVSALATVVWPTDWDPSLPAPTSNSTRQTVTSFATNVAEAFVQGVTEMHPDAAVIVACIVHISDPTELNLLTWKPCDSGGLIASSGQINLIQSNVKLQKNSHSKISC